MKNIKKWLSIWISAAMILALCPGYVFADTSTGVTAESSENKGSGNVASDSNGTESTGSENTGSTQSVMRTSGETITSTALNGFGTAENPYEIGSKGDLKYLRDLLSDDSTKDQYNRAYYKLTEDIDLRVDDDNIWNPMATGSNAFRGHFDGDGHTIDLHISYLKSRGIIHRSKCDLV